jgi:hypothetical protein
MKRGMVILSLGLIVLFVLAANLFGGEEKKMDKDQACAMAGTCSDEMVNAAKAMLDQCNKTIAKAQELMDKGKTVRGQGMLWGDKQMEADGLSIYEQGKKMYDDAKKLSETCSTIITEGEKMKNKYKKTGSDATPTPQKKGEEPKL